MQTRGWRGERTISATDPDGRPVNVVLGITTAQTTQAGEPVAAVTIGAEAPTAVLDREVRDKLVAHMRGAVRYTDAEPHTVKTRDTLRQLVFIVTGLSADRRGRQVPILRIGPKAQVVLTERVRRQVGRAMTAVLGDLDWIKRGGRLT